MQLPTRWLGTLAGGKGKNETKARKGPIFSAGPHAQALLLLLCFACLCTIGISDQFIPRALDLTLFYLAGCFFTGWAAGWRWGLTAVVVSWAFLVLDRAPAGGLSMAGWINGLNLAFRLAGLAAAGWLGAELGKRTRVLEAALQERTSRLQNAIGKHRGTAQLLREALGFLKQATENFAGVFWVTNPTRTEVEYVSHEFENLWGESCAAVYDAPGLWLARVHQEDRQRVAQAMRQKQVTGDYDEEYRIVRPDGVVRWVHDRAFPVKDEKGAVYRLMGIAEDITGRKLTQHLLEAQRDLGLALVAADDLEFALERLVELTVRLESFDCGAVYLMDRETGELRLKAHRGLSESILKGSSQYPAHSAEARLAKAGKLVYARGDQIPRAQQVPWGGEGLQALVLVPLRHQGAAVGLLNLGSYRESVIPEQIRMGLEVMASQAAAAIARIAAEQSLKQSEAHVRSIVNHAPIALLAVDARGVITFEDGQALGALGFKPAQHLKADATEVFKDHPLVLDDLDRARAGEEFSSVVEFGSAILENRYTPGPGGPKLGGFIAVSTDVTERIRLQRQILEISDREQARIGQDVHDGLCQQLIGSAFNANALEKTLAAQARPEATTARKVCALLDEAITESRRICRGLYPVRLETEGLVPALEELARSSAERYQLKCRLATDEQNLRCDEITATHLYRIIREAVNNAARHSGCRNIDIRLSSTAGQMEIVVQDDGHGMKPALPGHAGMGLHIMQYRARAIGGRLRISSDTGGTRVACQVPRPVEETRRELQSPPASPKPAATDRLS